MLSSFCPLLNGTFFHHLDSYLAELYSSACLAHQQFLLIAVEFIFTTGSSIVATPCC
jgi:hypothetical protein